jgi:predicted Zn-dependent peptidase
MKKLLLSIAAALPLALFAQVQIDRTKPPQPGPAPEIKITDPAQFTLANGLKVIVVTNTKLPQVSATLTLDRDPILEGDKSGMLAMVGDLMRRGTTKMKKADLDESIDFLGASLSVSSSSAFATSLKVHFPKMLEIMADVVLRPSFPADELEKIRTQTLSGLAQAKDDPGTIISNVVSKLTFGNKHPYGEITTEQTVKNVTLADIKKYHSTYWKPNIAYLVLVGDINPTEARLLATKYFGTWVRGIVPKHTYELPKAPAKSYVAVVNRPASVQSNIEISSPVVLKPGSSDAIPADVMNNILGGGFSGRLFANLRETYGFTYGAYSSLGTDKIVSSFSAEAAVRNEKTDSAIGQFLFEFNRIASEKVSDEEISRMKNYLSGSFARSLESPSTIARFALNTSLYNLPKDYYRNYLKNLASVDAAKVQEMAKAYVKTNNMHIVIVGNAKEIADGLDKYGEVKYFDIYGNEVAAPGSKQVAQGVTAQSVIEKAVKAVGGETAIDAIKDLQITGEATIIGQPMKLTFEMTHVVPGNYINSIQMGGMTLMKQMIKDGNYTMSMQGQSMPVEEDDQEEFNESAAISTELYMLRNKYNFELKGIESVEGKDAYEIRITSPKGRKYSNFYDVVTGFKLKEVKEQEGPDGEKASAQVFYSNYKLHGGIQVPEMILVDQGPIKIELKATAVKTNTGIKTADWK